jgi:hypothetical protein
MRGDTRINKHLVRAQKQTRPTPRSDTINRTDTGKAGSETVGPWARTGSRPNLAVNPRDRRSERGREGRPGRIPLAAAKKGESKAKRALRPRASSSSSMPGRAPARGPRAPAAAAAAGRRARADERRLPATRSMVGGRGAGRARALARCFAGSGLRGSGAPVWWGEIDSGPSRGRRRACCCCWEEKEGSQRAGRKRAHGSPVVSGPWAASVENELREFLFLLCEIT